MARSAQSRRRSRGFTLIELLTVVAIIGTLAAVAVTAYTRNAKNAHRSVVVANVSSLIMREEAWKATSGHYASTTSVHTATYPTETDVRSIQGNWYTWDINADGYTANNITPTGAPFFRCNNSAGNCARNLHGFDALRYLPENNQSRCGYGVVSGFGSDFPTAGSADVPPGDEVAAVLFPANTPHMITQDWFYAFAVCDLDGGGTGSNLSLFTATHYDPSVNSTATASGSYKAFD